MPPGVQLTIAVAAGRELPQAVRDAVSSLDKQLDRCVCVCSLGAPFW